MPEPVLRERLTSEGQPAFAELFQQYRQRLRSVVQLRLDRRLTGRVDPSDVLQETFLDAAARVPDYLGQEGMTLYIWLRFLTLQRLLQIHRFHLKTRQRSAELEVPLPAVATDTLAGQLVGSLTSPSQVAMRGELQQSLVEQLSAMEPIEREILALRHFEELSNQDIAAILGISTSAASKRYLRALRRLREAMDRVVSPGERA